MPNATCHIRASCTRGPNNGSSSLSTARARCVSSARRDLCGGRRAISVPTATRALQENFVELVVSGLRTLLTTRELEVLAALADGASNKAIARRLGISYHTAKFYVAAILTKLNADSRTEAVTRAAQLGLVML